MEGCIGATHGLEPFMLVCDLDGTLLGDEDALKHFFALWNRRTQLEASAGLGTRSRLVYATGRPHGTELGRLHEDWGSWYLNAHWQDGCPGQGPHSPCVNPHLDLLLCPWRAELILAASPLLILRGLRMSGGGGDPSGA